jgi:hypothetical protein
LVDVVAALPRPPRAWLDVPYAEKDEARRSGARWDPEARRWYAPRPGSRALARWAPLPALPSRLPGEDRTFGAGLFVDLIPVSCWFTNARSCLAHRDWERLRRMVTSRAGQRCEVCGAAPDHAAARRLEVHERWSYDEATRVQTLRRLLCLCSDCHTATHFGLAELRGLDRAALAQLRAVTGMSARRARDHVEAAFKTWEARSAIAWTLDLGILSGAGLVAAPPPSPADRARLAAPVTAPG